MKTSWIGSLSEHSLKSKIKNLKFGLVTWPCSLRFVYPPTRSSRRKSHE